MESHVLFRMENSSDEELEVHDVESVGDSSDSSSDDESYADTLDDLVLDYQNNSFDTSSTDLLPYYSSFARRTAYESEEELMNADMPPFVDQNDMNLWLALVEIPQ